MIHARNIDAVKSYIEDGGDIALKDENGYTAMNIAAISGNREIVNLLKDHGAKSDFFTELALGSVPKISACLANGYSANSVNEHGQQPLMIVAHQGHIDAARLLLDRGAVIDAAHAMSGNTALMGASSQGKAAMVRFLLENGADKTIRNLEGKDAAQLAAEAGFQGIAETIRNFKRY